MNRIKEHLDNCYNNWLVPDVDEKMYYGPNESDFLTPDQHKALATHLTSLIISAEAARSERNRAMEVDEMDLLGMVEPQGSDCERRRNRDEGKSAGVPDAIYPFGWLELQKFTSEILAMVMPIEAPYAVAASASKQSQVNALTKVFRHQAVQFDHRNNFHAALFDMVALDCGGLRYSWDSLSGSAYSQSIAGTTNADPSDVSGVFVKAVNPYNVSWDPTVEPPDVPHRAQFFAEFDLISPFELERTAGSTCFLSEKQLEALQNHCNLHWLAASHKNNTAVYSETFLHNWFYYRPATSAARSEILAAYGSDRRAGSQSNFSGLFTGVYSVPEGMRQYLHRTVIYVRLKPSRWGLGPKLTKEARKQERFQVWEIHLIANGLISFAQPACFQIDRIPACIGTMNYRRDFGRSFRFGDHAAQLGLLASTIMNMHKRAMRKGLEGGLTLYNPKVFDLSEIDESGTGRVAARAFSFDDDIRRHVMQLNDLPDYKNTMNDVNGIVQLMKDFFPASSQPALAGLDRATQYQAQAVTMTGARSMLFYAALADGQLGAPTRFAVSHLNLLNAKELSYVDEGTFELVRMSADEIKQTEFEIVQSQPLMGIDRLRAGNVLRDVTNILFQSGGQLPPLANFMLRHFMQIEGIPISMEEYERMAQEQMMMAQAQAEAEAGGMDGAAAQGQAEAIRAGTPQV